jgi:hypothetical protein
VERLGKEVLPEREELGEGFCKSGAAVRRGGKGCRSDRCHDAASVFRPRLLPRKTPFSALKTSFRLIY